MNWITKLFSSGATELVGTIGNVIDNLVTSDEERMQLKNAIDTKIMEHADRQRDRAVEHDKEVSRRHENDMKSDSWLSKNVRPLTLIFLTTSTVALAYLTIFTFKDSSKLALIMPWVDLLKTLLGVVFVFYFGSRGIEKVQQIKKGTP